MLGVAPPLRDAARQCPLPVGAESLPEFISNVKGRSIVATTHTLGEGTKQIHKTFMLLNLYLEKICALLDAMKTICSIILFFLTSCYKYGTIAEF